MKIIAKLLKVQAEIEPIAKDSLNPHFKNKYFDINSLLAVVKPVLTANQLVLMQPIIGEILYTRIYDAESAEVIESQFTLPQLPDMQKLGGAISYARRYALVSLLALEGDDDDGNTAKPNIAPYRTKIKASQTLDELVQVWKSIPPSIQSLLEADKDEKKTDLSKNKELSPDEAAEMLMSPIKDSEMPK